MFDDWWEVIALVQLHVACVGRFCFKILLCFFWVKRLFNASLRIEEIRCQRAPSVFLSSYFYWVVYRVFIDVSWSILLASRQRQRVSRQQCFRVSRTSATRSRPFISTRHIDILACFFCPFVTPSTRLTLISLRAIIPFDSSFFLKAWVSRMNHQVQGTWCLPCTKVLGFVKFLESLIRCDEEAGISEHLK
jgi:hypothetical protein